MRAWVSRAEKYVAPPPRCTLMPYSNKCAIILLTHCTEILVGVEMCGEWVFLHTEAVISSHCHCYLNRCSGLFVHITLKWQQIQYPKDNKGKRTVRRLGKWSFGFNCNALKGWALINQRENSHERFDRNSEGCCEDERLMKIYSCNFYFILIPPLSITLFSCLYPSYF